MTQSPRPKSPWMGKVISYPCEPCCPFGTEQRCNNWQDNYTDSLSAVYPDAARGACPDAGPDAGTCHSSDNTCYTCRDYYPRNTRHTCDTVQEYNHNHQVCNNDTLDTGSILHIGASPGTGEELKIS